MHGFGVEIFQYACYGCNRVVRDLEVGLRRGVSLLSFSHANAPSRKRLNLFLRRRNVVSAAKIAVVLSAL